MNRSASFARPFAAAGAALLLSFSTAHAAEILNYHGVWLASGSGDAYANVGTGLLGPGDYLVKWYSPQPFGHGSSWDDEFEVVHHAETYGGDVIFHDYFAGCACGLRLEATRSWTNQLHVEADRYVFFATRSGTVKKTPLSEFAFQLQRGKIAIGLDQGDALVDVQLTDGARDVMLFASNGKAVRFAEDAVRSMGRTATGVRGMRLAEGEQVVSMIVLDGDDDILTATERGYGKRTEVVDYPRKGRATQGVLTFKGVEDAARRALSRSSARNATVR
jgi:hypothetical protein